MSRLSRRINLEMTEAEADAIMNAAMVRDIPKAHLIRMVVDGAIRRGMVDQLISRSVVEATQKHPEQVGANLWKYHEDGSWRWGDWTVERMEPVRPGKTRNFTPEQHWWLVCEDPPVLEILHHRRGDSLRQAMRIITDLKEQALTPVKEDEDDGRSDHRQDGHL